nr:hypothetical protein [Tanacetum cinerariifolium]
MNFESTISDTTGLDVNVANNVKIGDWSLAAAVEKSHVAHSLVVAFQLLSFTSLCNNSWLISEPSFTPRLCAERSGPVVSYAMVENGCVPLCRS